MRVGVGVGVRVMVGVRVGVGDGIGVGVGVRVGVRVRGVALTSSGTQCARREARSRPSATFCSLLSTW